MIYLIIELKHLGNQRLALIQTEPLLIILVLDLRIVWSLNLFLVKNWIRRLIYLIYPLGMMVLILLTVQNLVGPVPDPNSKVVLLFKEYYRFLPYIY